VASVDSRQAPSRSAELYNPTGAVHAPVRGQPCQGGHIRPRSRDHVTIAGTYLGGTSFCKPLLLLQPAERGPGGEPRDIFGRVLSRERAPRVLTEPLLQQGVDINAVIDPSQFDSRHGTASLVDYE
jgi:hypothetical protein